MSNYESINTIRTNLHSNDDGRLLWLELIKAIGTALPRDERPKEEVKQTADDLRHREDLHIETLDCEHFSDVGVWYAELRSAIEEAKGIASSDAESKKEGTKGEPVAVAADEETLAEDAIGAEADFADAASEDDEYSNEAGDEEGDESEPAGPTGEGWIVQITGYHFHNSDIKKPGDFNLDDEAGQFVRRTLIKTLREGTVMLPDSKGNKVPVPMKDLGISYPVMVSSYRPIPVTYDPNAATQEEASRAWGDYRSATEGDDRTAGFGAAPKKETDVEVKKPEHWKLRRYSFEVQFIWQPKPRGERENPPLDSSDSDL